MIEWPDELIYDLARKRAVIFLGAGASRNSVGIGGSNPPLWNEFISAALSRCSNPKRHIQSLITGGDYLSACEIIKYRLDESWTQCVRQQFVDPQYTHNPLHETVFKLDARIVLTSNVDKIYDTYAQHSSNSTIAVKCYHEDDAAAAIRDGKQVVLKIHGSIDTPDKMIFTRHEYARARHNNASFYRLVEAILLTNTFLFIGCGINDPDITLLLEQVNYAYSSVRPHYICITRTASHEDTARVLRKSRNLKALYYNAADNHRDLQESLDDLLDKVDSAKQVVAEEQSW